MNKKTVLLVVGIIGVALIVARFTPSFTCRSPLFIPRDQAPEKIISRMIADLGGLPKDSLDLYEAQEGESTYFPVDQWRVVHTSLHNDKSLLESFTDDDPTHSYTIVVQVHYTDGDSAMVRWSGWHYGLVLCPVVVTGDGPPGRLIVSTTTSQHE